MEGRLLRGNLALLLDGDPARKVFVDRVLVYYILELLGVVEDANKVIGVLRQDVAFIEGVDAEWFS
jgi:hypothetical protein